MNPTADRSPHPSAGARAQTNAHPTRALPTTAPPPPVGACSQAKPLPARGSATDPSPASRLLQCRRGTELHHPARSTPPRHPGRSAAKSRDLRPSATPLPNTPRAHARPSDRPVGAGSPAKPLPTRGSATGRSPASRLLQALPCRRGTAGRHPGYNAAKSRDLGSSAAPLTATPWAPARPSDRPVGAGSPAKPLPARGAATGRSPASRLLRDPGLPSRVLHGGAA